MKTLTFKKIVSKDTVIDKSFELEIQSYYEDIILNIDEIEQWKYDGINENIEDDLNFLSIVYKVVFRDE